jgi:hypothetical protein
MGWFRNVKARRGYKIGRTKWVWDYATGGPVPAEQMPEGSKRWDASQRAKNSGECHLSWGDGYILGLKLVEMCNHLKLGEAEGEWIFELDGEEFIVTVGRRGPVV